MLFLNADGTVKAHQKISDTEGNFTGMLDDGDYFGCSVANVGDLDGDGVTDLAVGARGDDDGGTDRGAVWMLFLNSDGTVKAHQKISDTEGNFTGTLDDGDYFGCSVANVGDLDGDGVTDLAVGATATTTGARTGVRCGCCFSTPTARSKPTRRSATPRGTSPGRSMTGDCFGISVANMGDLDGDGVTDLAVGAHCDDDGGSDRGAVWMLSLAPGSDYGDAPDGPVLADTTRWPPTARRHEIVSDLFMGASRRWRGRGAADGRGRRATTSTSAGRRRRAEQPAVDLALTIGAQPTVNVNVTNTTGSGATLYGWIDYNGDGVFDNASERAQAAVPDATSGGIVTLTFPAVPEGFTGTTYARFRLSTDAAAADPTGPASDGEVEDYAVAITRGSSGTVEAHQKISDTEGDFTGTLDDYDASATRWRTWVTWTATA